MAPGLGLVPGMIVDQHFAERGRFAIVIEAEGFSVLGAGAVYVIDAREMSYTNIADATSGETLSVHYLVLHTLTHGQGFNLRTRQPGAPES